MTEILIERPKRSVTVLDERARTDVFRYFEVSSSDFPDGGLLLQVASSPEHNDELDRAALLLNIMRARSQEVEESYARSPQSDGRLLNYHYLFPEVVESWVEPRAENRRVILLKFPTETSIGYSPILHITNREKKRVDPRTSAWIMGKLLKLFTFTHPLNIAVGDLSPSNLMINRDHHFVLVLNWTQAHLVEDELDRQIRRSEIAAAAQAIQTLLGANLDKGVLPPDESLSDGRYEAFLESLAQGEISDAFEAHAKFYELVWGMWGRHFHPFTTYPIQ